MQKKAERKNAPVQRELHEMCGFETHTDSRGRMWGIRVFTLGEQREFNIAFAAFVQDPQSPTAQTSFIQRMLYPVLVTPWQRLRRMAGLPPFSNRFIRKRVIGKDFWPIVDAVFTANFDSNFVDFCKKISETANDEGKKKAGATSE